jgi:hypothetical protein
MPRKSKKGSGKRDMANTIGGIADNLVVARKALLLQRRTVDAELHRLDQLIGKLRFSRRCTIADLKAIVQLAEEDNGFSVGPARGTEEGGLVFEKTETMPPAQKSDRQSKATSLLSWRKVRGMTPWQTYHHYLKSDTLSGACLRVLSTRGWTRFQTAVDKVQAARPGTHFASVWTTLVHLAGKGWVTRNGVKMKDAMYMLTPPPRDAEEGKGQPA